MSYRVHIVTGEITANTVINTYSIQAAIEEACRKFNIEQNDIHEVTVCPEE